MPLNVMLELTWRCGAGCAFCFLGRTGRLNGRGRELGAAEIEGFLRRLPRGSGVYFTGGEPFLRRDIFRILSAASGLGLNWGVNTSGLNLDGRKVRRLMDLRPAYVIFSLHGPAPLHDRICGVKGAYGRVTANIASAAAGRLPGTEVMTNCVVNAANARALPAVYLAAARAGADRAVFEHLQFLKAGEAGGLDAGAVMTPVLPGYKLDVPAFLRSVEQIKALRGAFKTHFELRPDFSRAELERYYNGSPRPAACGSLADTVNVEPDGTVRVCVLGCETVADVRNFSLAALRAAKRRLLRGGAPRYCARCCQRFPIERAF